MAEPPAILPIKTEGCGKIERIHPDFAFHGFGLAESERHAAADPRTADHRVEIIEGQLLAGEREARGHADVLH